MENTNTSIEQTISQAVFVISVSLKRSQYPHLLDFKHNKHNKNKLLFKKKTIINKGTYHKTAQFYVNDSVL